jgi:hypothetical protein
MFWEGVPHWYSKMAAGAISPRDSVPAMVQTHKALKKKLTFIGRIKEHLYYIYM